LFVRHRPLLHLVGSDGDSAQIVVLDGHGLGPLLGFAGVGYECVCDALLPELDPNVIVTHNVQELSVVGAPLCKWLARGYQATSCLPHAQVLAAHHQHYVNRAPV
jgi:hypothetical protein